MLQTEAKEEGMAWMMMLIIVEVRREETKERLEVGKVGGKFNNGFYEHGRASGNKIIDWGRTLVIEDALERNNREPR